MKLPKLKDLLKSNIILQEAGEKTERQETGFINLIKKAVQENGGNPITINSKNETINDVIDAMKYSGRTSKGSEPYTDVQLILKNGDKINISMKGTSAPTVAGGGLRGIDDVIPGLASNFLNAAYKHHIKTLTAGDKVPDLYGKLNDRDKNLLVIGNLSIGGPIDFMYIGPMDVVGNFNNGTLSVNGQLISSDVFASSRDLYFRLRARRNDQVFDPEARYSNGAPKIYSKSPSKGDSAGRIFVTDKPAGNRAVIVF